jgi:acyl dehydratase
MHAGWRADILDGWAGTESIVRCEHFRTSRFLSPVPAGVSLRARVSVMQAEAVPPDALRVT